MKNIARRNRLQWTATVQHKVATGIPDTEYLLDEIRDLQDIMESGPDWNMIQKVVVVYNP